MAAFARVSALRALEAATVLGVAYLCLGELWPHTRSSPFRGQMWRRQQLFLLCSLSLAPLLLGELFYFPRIESCYGYFRRV